MLVTLLGILMLVRLSQEPKPQSPMLVTPSGIVTHVRLVQFVEGPVSDADNAITDRDARQAGATMEGIIPDAGDAVRNRDAGQAAAATEGIIFNVGDAVRDSYACQISAASEGIFRNTCNTVGDRVFSSCFCCRIRNE